MITLAIIKTDKSGKFHQQLVDSLNDNKEGISEIIFSGSEDDINLTGFENVSYLNIDSDNKSLIRNKVLERASGDYILWISNSCELDFDFVGEISQVIEEYPDVDIIYPNEVIIDIDNVETVRKFDDLYNKEIDLIRILKPEKNMPEWGVVTKKDIFERFGKFDESFEDYEFYNFLWENIKNIKLKHSKFSFIVNKHTDTFIDTSYNSYSLRKNISKYSLEELFPHLNWSNNENLALSTAYYMIGETLSDYYDLFNASEYFRKSAIAFHNKISIQRLINTYSNMGFFDRALELLRTDQGFTEEEIKNLTEDINNLKNLIYNIEKAISEGNIREIMESINEIYNVYKGAPILNILGVINYITGNKENAFRFFYKAVTINPIDDDMLHNLIDISKELGKEEKVKSLINRLIGK
ncbi:MAG: glycosyltransferase family 2 protein [Hydrogenothermaceae bacterium]|nr:glycosyltransferase family 2 protein [Hydrogenothermaceae bacterium]